MALDAELNDLLNMFAEGDRPVLEAAFERNPVGAAHLRAQNLVYRGLVDNDPTAQSSLAAAMSRQGIGSVTPQPQTSVQPQVTTQLQPQAQPASAASITLAEIEALLADKLKPLQERLDPTALDRHVEDLITRKATELRPLIIGEAAAIADNLSIIRASHRTEFGEELNRGDFEKFYTDNPGKFENLSKAHDAYVAEKRIQLQIQKGVAEALANRDTANVPGSTLNIATSDTPFAAMVRANPAYKAANGEAKGDALDQGARALRQLRGEHGW